jgi:predicted RNA-binding Zn ribbon-like protein
MSDKPVNHVSQVNSKLETLPSILTIPLVTDIPCLNFINTVENRLSPVKRRDTLATYADLIAFALRLNLLNVGAYTVLSKLATRSELFAERSLSDARAFRNALTSIVDTLVRAQSRLQERNIHPEALAIFDAARRKAHESESLSWSDNQLNIVTGPEDEGLDAPWLILVRDAERLLCSNDATRIRICSAEGCGWAFLDQSKNSTRRWCSMQSCGNREKALRFKSRNEKQ